MTDDKDWRGQLIEICASPKIQNRHVTGHNVIWSIKSRIYHYNWEVILRKYP